MQIIDLTPYLPARQEPVRKTHDFTALAAVVESVVTVAIGVCFFAGLVIAISFL